MSSKEEANYCATLLREGQIIAYPTDTIWGIGCHAYLADACERIADLKGRAVEKTMILLVADLEMLMRYVPKLSPKMQALHDYHTRPVTVVYDTPHDLPPHLLASDGSVAIRIARDEFCQNLIRTLDAPIISTSANLSGQPAPAHFDEVTRDILDNVDYVVEHRRLDRTTALPSTIVRLTAKGDLMVLRP